MPDRRGENEWVVRRKALFRPERAGSGRRRHTLTALLLVTVGIGFGSVTVPAVVGQSAVVGQFEWLQSVIERIDRFLEAVLDLVNTIRAPFGG